MHRFAIPFLIITLTVLLSPTSLAQDTVSPLPSPAKRTVLYTCPMHPEVHSHAPGKCPKCKMTLVATAEQGGEGEDHPMHASQAAMPTISGGPFHSMSALGSGTALQPSSTPMSAWHAMLGGWMLMLHGEIKAGFDYQGGWRGVGKAESQNWLMLMAEANAGPGRLMLRGMFTAEPLTAPHGGFPQLFQTGETYRGYPIIDAQHPHDLFMELAAGYTLPISERVSLQIYGGPVAEPALGPVAFMHRASAVENPASPLGHHWQDSTHVSHGVITGALTAGRFKFEASGFHGAEPDEDRVRIDLGRLDSYSFRAWFTPTPDWAMQFSYGHLNNPEVLHPGDLDRLTASVAYNRRLRAGSWASTLIWGRNSEVHGDSNSYLFESTLNFLGKNHVYLRTELVDKQGFFDDNIFGRPGLICLRVKTANAKQGGTINVTGPSKVVCTPRGLPNQGSPASVSILNQEYVVNHGGAPPIPGRAYPPEFFNRWFRVGAFTLGGVRDFVANEEVRIGVGADATYYYHPASLDLIYGLRPVSFHVFLRFRPGEMK